MYFLVTFHITIQLGKQLIDTQNLWGDPHYLKPRLGLFVQL